MDKEVPTEASPRRRHGRRIGIDRPAMLREVNRRKAVIVEALHRRDLGLFNQLIEELIEYQRAGEPVHVAKSLCDLAMEAKNLRMFGLQVELTARSVTVAPDDGWSWAQHGDALLNMNRFDQAFQAYQQAKSFGAGVIARLAGPKCLRRRDVFPPLLLLFDEVIREHPENVFAKTGRAEVLKSQGEFEAALAAYEQIIREHPENVVAKAGRAEVLKAQGELEVALVAYEQIIREHPENVFAKAGRAEVLKCRASWRPRWRPTSRSSASIRRMSSPRPAGRKSSRRRGEEWGGGV